MKILNYNFHTHYLFYENQTTYAVEFEHPNTLHFNDSHVDLTVAKSGI